MDALSNEDENETLPANLGPMRGAADDDDDDGAAQVSDVLLDKGKETTGKRTELEERRGARMRGLECGGSRTKLASEDRKVSFQERKTPKTSTATVHRSKVDK